MKVIIKSLDETKILAHQLKEFLYPNFFLSLNGDLGAGKTTFTKYLGLALGINKTINSPTFTIMKVYDTNHFNGIDKLYHLDVYRLKGASDDFELEEYFYLDSLVVVEWCDIIKDIIPDDYLDINITLNNNYRIFEIIEHGNMHIVNDLKQKLEGENLEVIC